MNPAYDAIAELMSYYKPLHELGYTIDIVPPERDLTKYKLVIAPGLNVLTQAEADNLARYIKQGGHLVLGQRSGMKDEYEARWPQRQPGPLAALLGARVEQYTALDEPVDTAGAWGEAKAQLFAEQLKAQADDVIVEMTYHAPRSWLDGQPAAVTRKAGKGSISYVGVWLDDVGMKRAVQWMLTESGANPDLFPAPAGVEVYRRVGNHCEVFIVANDSREEQTVALPSAMKDVLVNEMVRAVTLPIYGVSVLEKASCGE